MNNDFTDTTAVTDVASVTDTPQAVSYGAAAAAAIVYPPVTQTLPSPTPLIRSLRLVDLQGGIIEPESSLSAVDLRFQESMGIYCELISQGELEEFALASGSPLNIQYIAVFNEAGKRVRELTYKVYSENSYTAIWDGRDADGFFVPAGNYHARARVGVDYYNYEALSSEIAVTGDPYTISVVFTPKNDENLEEAIKSLDSLGVNTNGHRLMRDCWAKVYRGGNPGSGREVLVARRIDKGRIKPAFEGHIEATNPGYFSTPKRIYQARYGQKTQSWFRPCPHSSIEFGEDERLRIYLVQAPTIEINLFQPATNSDYKIFVEVHKGYERNGYVSYGTSEGCPVVALELPVTRNSIRPYGQGLIDGRIEKFGTLKNRQISDNYMEENGEDFLSCVYGGFTHDEIKQKLNILVQLNPPLVGSTYEKLHRFPVAVGGEHFFWFTERKTFLIFMCRVRKANTVLRKVPLAGNFKGEDLVVKVHEDNDSIDFMPVLRYRSSQKLNESSLILEHKLTEEEYDAESPTETYTIKIWVENLMREIKYALQEGNVSLVLKVNFAWDWRRRTWDPATHRPAWTPLPISPPYNTYIPTIDPNDRKRRRWDCDKSKWQTCKLEFEFPIPSPIQEA